MDYLRFFGLRLLDWLLDTDPWLIAFLAVVLLLLAVLLTGGSPA